MADTGEFIAWATNPKLNLEEAFCAELIVERALEFWRMKNRMADPEGWDLKRERHKKRALNPAHRIKLDPKEVERAASVIGDISSLTVTASKYTSEDRPLRDIFGFRFLTALKTASIHGSEISDASAFSALSELQTLHLADEELENVQPLAECEKLQSLSLRLSQPWPQLPSFANLTSLKTFQWHGNPFVLEGVPVLPAVVSAKFEGGFQWKVPLRDLQRLPEMPNLRVLELDPAWSIAGIERWPTLTNLVLSGSVRDLQPLQRLPHLTHLTIKTDRLRNVQHLVGVPELRYLLVESEHPVDFSSLIDAPRLHEIEMKRCEINKMELATLNSVLPSWDEAFAAATPRVIAPLQKRFIPDQQVFREKNPGAASPEEVEKDPGLFESEARWLKRKLQKRLNRFLDSDKWGEIDASGNGYRAGTISIHSLDAAESLSDIVQIIRETLVQTKHEWQIMLRIALQADWQEKYPELEKELRRKQMIEEELDFEARQKERQEFLERKHRADLLQQEGMKVKPEDFAAPEREVESASDDFGDQLSMPEDPEAHPMAEQLNCLALLTERELVVGESARYAIQQLLRSAQ